MDSAALLKIKSHLLVDAAELLADEENAELRMDFFASILELGRAHTWSELLAWMTNSAWDFDGAIASVLFALEPSMQMDDVELFFRTDWSTGL